MLKNLENNYGINITIREIKITGLPLYMTSGRTFYEAHFNDSLFYIVQVDSIDRFGVIAFEKQLIKYQEITNIDVAYSFSELTKTQRDALVKRNIPFVCGDDQFYMPFLGVMLSNQFKRKIEFNSSKMMPSTQALFLYLLFKCKDKKVMKKQAAEDLGLTRTSITRASEQLSSMNLLGQDVNGKESLIYLVSYGRDSFDLARTYLINPVQKRLFVEIPMNSFNWPLSGVSALGKTSMINSPEVPCFAIDKNSVEANSLISIDVGWDIEKSCMEVELWKYNPVLFQKDGLVDPISLIMSLQNIEDERIEEAALQYLENFEW